MKRIYSFLFASAATLMLVGCDKAQDKPEPTPPTPPTPKTEVTTHTVTPQGGNFDYKGDIKLVIPKDGVKENTQIEAKYSAGAGNFDYQGMFEPLGKGIEITLKPETLKKGFEIEFPAPEGFDPETTVAIQYVQGQSEGRATTAKSTKSEQVFAHKLIPVGGNRLRLQVDTIARANNAKITENVFTVVKDKRVVPLENRGLRLISFPKEDMVFNELGDLNNKRCLVLIHGWTSNPKDCWTKFVKHTGIDKLKNDYNYDAILTYGYNTGLNIDKNGEFLADRIKLYLSNSTVDIVAHSMGGLVSRSAIENHGAEPYVRTLITLGTPHRGSPLAGASWILSTINALDRTGGNDLAEDSEIIKKLASNPEPSTNYYFIAGRRDDDNDDTDKDGDGVVPIESATNKWTDEDKIEIFNFSDWAVFPHTKLTDDSRIINHTLEKLREFANSKQKTEENNTLPEGVVIENGVLKSWPSSAIPVNGHINVPSSVTSIGNNAFLDCRNLKTITLPEGLTSIGNDAFRGCSSLKAISIPNTVKTLGVNLFRGCANLVEIRLPKELKAIPNNAFEQCFNLNKIELPASLQSIGSSAFNSCNSLVEIKLGDNITELGDHAFRACTSLKNIVLPTSLNRISHFLFMDCYNLTEIIIPNSIYSIGESFKNCKSLTQLTLPQSVKVVDEKFVKGCVKLVSITCKGIEPPAGGYIPIPRRIEYKGKIIVPKGCKSTYESHNSWRDCSPVLEEE